MEENWGDKEKNQWHYGVEEKKWGKSAKGMSHIDSCVLSDLIFEIVFIWSNLHFINIENILDKHGKRNEEVNELE